MPPSAPENPTGSSSHSTRRSSGIWRSSASQPACCSPRFPALQVSKTNVNEILKESGRGDGGQRARWFSSTMVDLVELALTIVLLVGAGLMIRSFLKLYSLNLGSPDKTMSTERCERACQIGRSEFRQRRLFSHGCSAGAAGRSGASRCSAIAPANLRFGGSDAHRLEMSGHPPAQADGSCPAHRLRHHQLALLFNIIGVTMLRGRALTEH